MAFQAGSTIRPELGNADYSGFANAASIRANALANLGKQIGDGIEKYRENKNITIAGLASLEGQVAADPTLLVEFQNDTGDVGKAYKNIQSGDYKRKDVLIAGGFASSYANQQKIAQDSQIRELQLQAAKSEQKEQQISRSALDMALSASREAGTGEINPAALSAAYFDQGGRDPNDLKIIESMQKMKGSNFEAIDVGEFKVLTEDGEYKQSFRAGEEADPSAQRLLEFKLGERKKARELYEQGNTQEANDILAVNGYKDMFGRPQSAEKAFGPLDPEDPKDPNNGSSGLADVVIVDPKPFDSDALTGKDKEAYDFAIKNPNAPQSALILRSLRAN
tara:strand:+ start:1687 stop:2694 length:1008 start_codon:yes stop_codon:yes gene_type:complete